MAVPDETPEFPHDGTDDDVLGAAPVASAGRVSTAPSWAAFAAVVLTVIGFGLWALYRFDIGREDHSYVSGATPPGFVQVTAGKTYSLGLHGGVGAVAGAGVDIGSLSCTYEPRGAAALQLAVTPDSKDTKATNEIASFASPVSGEIHVACQGLPALFVDDADDAGTDWADVWLLFASICLAVSLPLLLSVYRRAGEPVATV